MTIGPAKTLMFLYFHAIHHGELPNSPSFLKREWEVIGSHPILPILQLCALSFLSLSHSSVAVFRWKFQRFGNEARLIWLSIVLNSKVP